ncbi:hypothetical protein I4U23_027103 [Adineta vaga]|nr:hypothetical protein I4U23_027103 [Adineta vaga]
MNNKGGCGIQFDKINPNHISTAPSSEIVDNELEKKTHYAFVIDVPGSSNEDLYVVSQTDYARHIESTYKEHKCDHYLLIKKLGKISLGDILQFHVTTHFVKHIEYKLINEVYNHLYKANNGPYWSSILNCQTFTRASIEHLGFEFPSTVRIISDCMSTLMDFYIKTYENTNK